MKIYLIRNKIDPELYWHNTNGWDLLGGHVDVFTLDERYNLNLPMDGEWVEFSEN